jgi:hypothetical protein
LLSRTNGFSFFSELIGEKQHVGASKIGRIEGGSIQFIQRQSAEKPSKWFEVLSNNR